MPKRALKTKAASGKSSKTHLKIAAVISAVTRLVPRSRRNARNATDTSIAAFIPNRLQVGNSVIIELTFPGSGQTFAMQGKVQAIERHQTGGPSMDECALATS